MISYRRIQSEGPAKHCKRNCNCYSAYINKRAYWVRKLKQVFYLFLIYLLLPELRYSNFVMKHTRYRERRDKTEYVVLFSQCVAEETLKLFTNYMMLLILYSNDACFSFILCQIFNVWLTIAHTNLHPHLFIVIARFDAHFLIWKPSN